MRTERWITCPKARAILTWFLFVATIHVVSISGWVLLNQHNVLLSWFGGLLFVLAVPYHVLPWLLMILLTLILGVFSWLPSFNIAPGMFLMGWGLLTLLHLKRIQCRGAREARKTYWQLYLVGFTGTGLLFVSVLVVP